MPFMLRVLVGTAALALCATAAAAQSDAIATRKQTMKGVGDATRAGSAMVKGESPFDAAKAREIFRTYANAADKMHTYFPENSKTGGETTAAPKIWESQAEFRKRFDDWAADIKKASAQADDLGSFKEAFTTVTKACGGCHENFRIKKN
jgi:cytochrome c556